MANYLFMPPLTRISGGMAVILRLAEHLHAAGQEVFLVRREGHGPFPQSPDTPTVAWEGLRLTSDDLWLVPEGWPNALLPGLQAGAHCVVYVQNWAFLLGNLPGHDDRAWAQLPIEFLSVSAPVAWFVEQATGKQSAVLRPGIDLELFHPPVVPRPSQPLRIAWMPRKNVALAKQIRGMVEARNLLPPHEWIEIHNLPLEGVAEALRRSHIFLATGFPEGCPLPPLEALACGCVVAGFSGLGGWDYMRQIASFPGAFTPWWPLRDVSFGNNGFYAADADVPAAAFALEAAAQLVFENGDAYSAQQEAARATAEAYSLKIQRESAQNLFCKSCT